MTNCKFPFGSQIYPFKMWQFWWSQRWSNLFECKSGVVQCVQYICRITFDVGLILFKENAIEIGILTNIPLHCTVKLVVKSSKAMWNIYNKVFICFCSSYWDSQCKSQKLNPRWNINNESHLSHKYNYTNHADLCCNK